jgi:lysozyme family protein
MSEAATVFDQCFAITVGIEGARLSTDPNDRGNWTTGVVGKGVCKGSKFGISAESHPDLDIANLTQDAAKALYRADEWARIRGDDLPPPMACLAFDAAVNNGDGRAERWLQSAAGAHVDGQVGDLTIAAVKARAAAVGGFQLCADFMALRLAFMSLLPTWRLYGANPASYAPEGWAKRLSVLPFLAMSITV